MWEALTLVELPQRDSSFGGIVGHQWSIESHIVSQAVNMVPWIFLFGLHCKSKLQNLLQHLDYCLIFSKKKKSLNLAIQSTHFYLTASGQGLKQMLLLPYGVVSPPSTENFHYPSCTKPRPLHSLALTDCPPPVT